MLQYVGWKMFISIYCQKWEMQAIWAEVRLENPSMNASDCRFYPQWITVHSSYASSMCVPGNQTHDLDLFMARWALGTEAGMTSTPWASLSLNSASVFSFCVSSHQFTSCRIKPLMNTKAARVHYHSCDPGFRESLNSCCSGRTHCNKARLL